MRFIGSLATTGGPLCITAAELAAEWNGTEGDYWELIESVQQRRQLLATYVNQQGVCVGAYRTEMASVAVFAARDEFALLEILQSPDDFEIEGFWFRPEGLALAVRSVRIAGIGGRVVLFDSTLDGTQLDLEGLGHGEVVRSLDPGFAIPDTVLLDVEPGTWLATEFAYEGDDGTLAARGVWFQREDGSP